MARYGMVIDLDRCIGCQTCRIACKVEHNLETGSGIRVDTIGGKYPDTPAGKHVIRSALLIWTSV